MEHLYMYPEQKGIHCKECKDEKDGFSYRHGGLVFLESLTEFFFLLFIEFFRFSESMFNSVTKIEP